MKIKSGKTMKSHTTAIYGNDTVVMADGIPNQDQEGRGGCQPSIPIRTKSTRVFSAINRYEK